MTLKYVSILCPGFSGSTLVSMLLGSQPRSVGFGDTYVSHVPRHYPKHPCTCGNWYDECAPRAAAFKAIQDGGFPDCRWDNITAIPIPGWFPTRFRRFLPSRCLAHNFRFRVMSPP